MNEVKPCQKFDAITPVPIAHHARMQLIMIHITHFKPNMMAKKDAPTKDGAIIQKNTFVAKRCNMHRFKRRTYEELAFNYDNEEPPEDAFPDDPEEPDEFFPESEEFEASDGPR